MTDFHQKIIISATNVTVAFISWDFNSEIWMFPWKVSLRLALSLHSVLLYLQKQIRYSVEMKHRNFIYSISRITSHASKLQVMSTTQWFQKQFRSANRKTSPPVSCYVRQVINQRLFSYHNITFWTTKEYILTFCQCPLFCTHKPRQIHLYQLFDVH